MFGLTFLFWRKVISHVLKPVSLVIGQGNDNATALTRELLSFSLSVKLVFEINGNFSNAVCNMNMF